MIAYITLTLFVIALLGSINIDIKKDRLFSFLMFILLCGIFAFFGFDFAAGKDSVLAFLWNSSPGGDVKIDIISNAYNYNLILPFFTITILAAWQNILLRYEERRSAYNAALVFNLAILIIMITGNNFVQLLFALFVIDILALFLIKDIEAYRRYILLNIFADMLIFTVMAIINCKVDSLDIREILRYKQIGHHLDFIAIAGLSAVFMKIGLFAFHIGGAGLQNIRLHRLQNVWFLSSPISGLIMLMKFHVLWNSSIYFAPYLHSICILSMFGGFWGSLCAKHFKLKVIYWQMMFGAILVELLCFRGFEWSTEFSLLLLQMYILAEALYLIYYYTGRCNLISEIIKRRLNNETALNMAFVLLLLAFIAITGTLTALYNRGNRYYIWTFAVLYTISLAVSIRQMIFLSRSSTITVKTPSVRMHWILFIILGSLSAFVLQPKQLLAPSVLGFTVAFLFLCCYMPATKQIAFYGRGKNRDYIGMIYKYLIIKPLRLCGKFLWILIDRLLVEKIIIEISSTLAQKAIIGFRRAHQNTTMGQLMIVFVLIGLICVAFSYGGYK